MRSLSALLLICIVALLVVTLVTPPDEPRPRSDFRPPPEPTADPTTGRWQPATPVICWQSPVTPVPGAGHICLPPKY